MQSAVSGGLLLTGMAGRTQVQKVADAVLTNPAYHLKRIGLEAGPLSQWLFSALAEAGLPVICARANANEKIKLIQPACRTTPRIVAVSSEEPHTGSAAP